MTERALVPHRSTEGSKKGVAAHARNPESRGRRRGRPAGSSNKPKTLFPKEMANEILLRMKEMLPPEHYDYMRGVIRDGKAVSLEHELDTIILLLSRNLLPVMVNETLPKTVKEFDPETGEITETQGEPEFRKDVTERLKVLNSLLTLKHQVTKSAEPDNREKPILEVFARRGIDGERFAFLLGGQSLPVAGNADGVGREADETRTVSGEILERPLALPARTEVEAVGVLNDYLGGDGGDSGD